MVGSLVLSAELTVSLGVDVGSAADRMRQGIPRIGFLGTKKFLLLLLFTTSPGEVAFPSGYSQYSRVGWLVVKDPSTN